MKNFKIDFNLSEFDTNKYEMKATDYVLNKELQSAVKVAIALGQPLLITGEPGTGKTKLAYKVAKDLSEKNNNFLQKPLIFNAKTTSTASDLFYIYDAVKHFHDANIKKNQNEELKTSKYITLQALGKAIVYTDKEELQRQEYLKTDAKTPKSSVVLIDEIDKAPRDFPNDILAEIENFEFTIKETDKKFKKSEQQKTIVILTSNSEKNLPDAFLRRCVFFHIPFPENEQLIDIVKAHLGGNSEFANSNFIDFFLKIRNQMTKKKPATAELIAWLKVLEIEKFIETNKTPDFNNLSTRQKDILKISYSLLAKTKDDFLNIEFRN